MALVKRALSLNPHTAQRGFDLITPTLETYRDGGSFLSAVKAQHENTVVIDAHWLESIDVDGRVNGTEYRLSKAAFGDLCHFSGIPVKFIKDLAQESDALALEVITHCIEQRLFGHKKSVVIDKRHNRIDGIVSNHTYTHVSNSAILEAVHAASKSLQVSGGWLCGPDMRVTALSADNPVEVAVGDIVRTGIDCSNSINGDGSVAMYQYNERLSCTNGMRRTERGQFYRFVHRGDALDSTQQAVVHLAAKADTMIPALQAAAVQRMKADQIRALRLYISNPSNGGSPGLESSVVEAAPINAAKSGRDQYDLTLWDMVNGITEQAHSTKSIQRRVAIEGLAFATMAKFGTVHAE